MGPFPGTKCDCTVFETKHSVLKLYLVSVLRWTGGKLSMQLVQSLYLCCVWYIEANNKVKNPVLQYMYVYITVRSL
jgi:hypothetical protein